MIAFISAVMLPSVAFGLDPITVPSGQPITFHEIISDQPTQGATHRFRFVTPQIARRFGEVDFESVEGDMGYLCREFVIPQLLLNNETPETIVISFSDRITEFAQPAPDVTQFFEAFRIENNNCIWEPF